MTFKSFASAALVVGLSLVASTATIGCAAEDGDAGASRASNLDEGTAFDWDKLQPFEASSCVADEKDGLKQDAMLLERSVRSSRGWKKEAWRIGSYRVFTRDRARDGSRPWSKTSRYLYRLAYEKDLGYRGTPVVESTPLTSGSVYARPIQGSSIGKFEGAVSFGEIGGIPVPGSNHRAWGTKNEVIEIDDVQEGEKIFPYQDSAKRVDAFSSYDPNGVETTFGKGCIRIVQRKHTKSWEYETVFFAAVDLRADRTPAPPPVNENDYIDEPQEPRSAGPSIDY